MQNAGAYAEFLVPFEEPTDARLDEIARKVTTFGPSHVLLAGAANVMEKLVERVERHRVGTIAPSQRSERCARGDLLPRSRPELAALAERPRYRPRAHGGAATKKRKSAATTAARDENATRAFADGGRVVVENS
jgi:hypothetical protein